MNKQECINELQSFVDEIQILLDFLGQNQITTEDKQQAQEMLKAFKQRLETAYKERSKVSAEKKMTEIEKLYFLPAVHQASANITITARSNPNEKWKFELIDTQNTINDYLSQLKSETT